VTGVIKDVPESSHLHFDVLFSYLTIYSGRYPYKEADYDFRDSDFWHYIQLKRGADYKTLEAKLEGFSQRYFQGDKVSGSVEKFHLQPLSKTHLYSDFEYEIGNTGSATVVWGLKVNTQNMPSAIAAIKKVYDKVFPGNYFDYSFLDARYNAQYANDQLFGKAFTIFSGFAIFIACLGLLGLSLFATAQRTKEIGVRKVLGASVGNIVLLLSRDFIGLVSIAFIIASPIAWLLMHKWLQDFTYRIDIDWWIFILAGLLAVVIALANISWQAVHAAAANPVKALRSE
jgi:putative ABC transport system permease protein